MSGSDQKEAKVLMVLPSLRLSGGIKEALRLVDDLTERAIRIQIIVLWKSDYELPCPGLPVLYLSRFATKKSIAMLQYPLLVLRFFLFLRRRYPGHERSKVVCILTHFSTFGLGWVSSWRARYCFNQDIEWMFVKDGWRRSLLRRFILFTSRRSRVLTTNAYVENLYEREGIRPAGRLSIWPPLCWLTSGQNLLREIDVVMMMRRGHMKRMDLYLELLIQMKQSGLSCFVISPDAEIAAQIANRGIEGTLRPTDDQIREIYQRSKVFLLLSDTEGFALPPLEAMGSGCVPLCRDSGGPQCYMTGLLAQNLIPLHTSATEIVAKLKALLSDPERLSILSEYARSVFLSGFERSVMKRSECISSLSRALRDE